MKSIRHLQHVILPFLSKYPLTGFKKKQFDLWKEAIIICLKDKTTNKNRQLALDNKLVELTALRNKTIDTKKIINELN